jgi:hypothetical protein
VWNDGQFTYTLTCGNIYYAHELIKLKKTQNIHTCSFDPTLSMYTILNSNRNNEGAVKRKRIPTDLNSLIYHKSLFFIIAKL